MKFIADFHVHSKYSRATAKALDLEHLYIAAQIKGITVIGTGDFTHPAWFSEITEKLVPAEPGLFKLKEGIAAICDKEVPDSCKSPVRFILTTEISNIYKKKEKTRKNHNLIFLPDMESVSRFNKDLDAIGNIHSDGRPILGLDAKHLLEIMLEINDAGFLVPAHIWTPWFSLFGSKSGFDSMEECFEDLSSHIFAVETGLSSDPAMNWRLSALDDLTLISNSDAHSPFNLGREANRFDTDLSYAAIKDALKTGDPDKFLGTFEFFPEEGKYHFDGHRKCNVCCHPQESMDHKGLCPECGKPLTLGVLYRVEELADRRDGTKPPSANEYVSIIPLTDILSDILLVGPASKKVKTGYNESVQLLGPEFDILHVLSLDRIKTSKIPLLGEAIGRMRSGRVHIAPGYDGEFGKVKIFTPEERAHFLGQKALFGMSLDTYEKKIPPKTKPEKALNPGTLPRNSNISAFSTSVAFGKSKHIDLPKNILTGLNDDQKSAVLHDTGPLLISAGPGTGKTRTLTHRIAYLISEKNIRPENILALTFTNKATGEMKERLGALLSNNGALPLTNTFHGFCSTFLGAFAGQINKASFAVIDDKDQSQLISIAMELSAAKNIPDISAEEVKNRIMRAKQFIIGPEEDLSNIVSENQLSFFKNVYGNYQRLLAFQNLVDYEDLIHKTVHLLESHESIKKEYQNRFTHIFVDEYQDINHGQYRLIRALSPMGQNLCVIGDPNQSIYGFRGADPSYFKAFLTDFPTATSVTLTQNYRSDEIILKGSAQIIQSQVDAPSPIRLYSGIKGLDRMGVLCSPTEKSEAVTIGKMIEEMVGGIGFHSMDFGQKKDMPKMVERSFSDFAVLYRTQKQGQILAHVLGKANIPYQIANKENFLYKKGICELIALFRLIEGSGAYFDFEKVLLLPGSGVGLKTCRSFKKWFFELQKPLDTAFSNIHRLPQKFINTTAQLKLDQFISQLLQIKDVIKRYCVADKLRHLSKLPLLKPTLDKTENATDTLSELFHIASGFNNDSVAFCTYLNLQSDNDFYDPRVEKVTLMTFHASKGLEFPVVFICGCENGIIPYHRAKGFCDNEPEERRLFYVAMTRAKEDLYFSWAKKRKIFGKIENRDISPYVLEMENHLVRNQAAKINPKKPESPSQLSLF